MFAAARRPVTRAAAALILGIVATPLPAQDVSRDFAWRSPPRPRLPAAADTNDWHAYVALGDALGARGKSEEAAAAYYWAVRLDPSIVEPRVARWAALVRSARGRVFTLIEKKKTASRAIAIMSAVDTVLLEAIHRNPMVTYEFQFGSCYDLRYSTDGRVIAKSREGVTEFCQRNWKGAVMGLTHQISEHPERLQLRIDRAKALYYLGEFDEAAAEIERLAHAKQEVADTALGSELFTTAMDYYAMGMIYTAHSDYFRARSAFEKAIGEDISFAWAHARLAKVTYVQGDTAAALSEFDQAVQIDPADPEIRYDYAVVLQKSDRPIEAETQYRKVIEIDPEFANAYFNLAVLLDEHGGGAEAARMYEMFVARAPHQLADKAQQARQRAAALKADQ